MAPISPNTAFNLVVTRLSSKNLTDLWLSSCVWSCIDLVDGQEHGHNFLFPTINHERISILQRAILASSALDSKNTLFTSRDLVFVYNNLNDTSNRSELLSGPESGEVKLMRLLSIMAQTQFRSQERDFNQRIGRAFALLYKIPLDFKDEIKERYRQRYIDLPEVVNSLTKLTVGEFLIIGFGALALMMQRYKTNFSLRDDIRAYTTERNRNYIERHAQVLGQIIDEAKFWQRNLIFQAGDLVLPSVPALTLEKVIQYLTLMSKSTQELREIIKQQPVYSEGHIADRLNPLERFPIVRLVDNRYIAPNLRHLDMSLTEVLHFMLQGAYKDNAYNELRGHIQEIYLRLLVEDRLTDKLIIPEMRYRRGKNKVDGPDVTIIERNKYLIVLESKAKRVSFSSRVNLFTASSIIDELNKVFDAFENAPKKIQELYDGLPEYSAFQPRIEQTKAYQPIVVVVIGEGIYFIQEVLRHELEQNKALKNYPFPYCLMAINVFERAVEIAASNDIALYDLLYEYWDTTRNINFNDSSAELFKGRTWSMEAMFTRKFSDMLFAVYGNIIE
jgi:hypothetical protein